MPFNEQMMDFILELWIKYKRIGQKFDDDEEFFQEDEQNSPNRSEENNEELSDYINISDTLFILSLYFIQNKSLEQKELSEYLDNIGSSFLEKEMLKQLKKLTPDTIEKYSDGYHLLKQCLLSSKL